MATEELHLKFTRRRRKKRLKSYITYILGGLLVSYVCFFLVFTPNIDLTNQHSHVRYLLTKDQNNTAPLDLDQNPNAILYDIFTHEQRQNGAIILHVLGLIYMFLGIAIACDDFFVPALEEIGEDLGWSDDVTGATMMAAGGSAPELFTSLYGTLILRTDVGFGTIVGSAVFNVLFVIAMCALFSKEILELTGWPLARDSSYYIFSLLVLSLFLGGTSKDLIEWWEALLLFMLYFLYVFGMKNNQRIKDYYDNNFQSKAKDVELGDVQSTERKTLKEEALDTVGSLAIPGDSTSGSAPPISSSPRSTVTSRNSKSTQRPSFKRPSSIREPIFRQLTSKTITAPSTDAVLAIFDDCEFPKGDIDKEAMKRILQETGHKGNADKFFSNWDRGTLSYDDFNNWYCEISTKFQKIIYEAFPQENIVSDKELETGLKKINTGDKEVQVVCADFSQFMRKKEEKEEKTDTNTYVREELLKWYRIEYFFTVIIQNDNDNDDDDDDDDEGEEEFDLAWPDNLPGQIFYIIASPIMYSMVLTMPYFYSSDKSRRKKYVIVTFFVSILWIGVFSMFMNEWAEILARTMGMSPKMMGLTILAAGTSIPDLLSSVIVARQGKGDMAVSSSIGSNIFDILIGLPIPWLLANIIFGHAVDVETGENGTLGFSIVVLMLMLGSTIITIAVFQWKMTKLLALIMMILWVIFLVQELTRADGLWSVPF